MWIAKPLEALTPAEKTAWRQVGASLPLSQRLCWGSAIAAVSGKPYLVFSTEENAGGLVFGSGDGQFECVNGPFLAWDDPGRIARQFSTFAMAVSKLDRGFRSLHVRPRWEYATLARRLAALPLEARKIDRAATWRIPLSGSREDWLKSCAPRLRRSLKRSLAYQIEQRCRPLSHAELEGFVPELRKFGGAHGFTVPPLAWFSALLKAGEEDGVRFFLISSSLSHQGAGAEAEILVCVKGSEAHYLFGRETRAPAIGSSLSPASLVHWRAFEACVSEGVSVYDMNGYLPDWEKQRTAENQRENPHPYAGVCEFKRQFGGSVLEFAIPEFVIA